MKIEHKQTIENIVFILLLFLVCWLTQFVCNLDRPDIIEIEEIGN